MSICSTIKIKKELYVLEISSEPSTNACLLGGRIDGDKNKVGFLDALVDIGREEEIATACFSNHFFETGLINGKSKIGAVPSVDACLIEVDDGDTNMRAFKGDDGASWAT